MSDLEPVPPVLFFDSSALISGVISVEGGARALLLLAEGGLVTITISDQVVAETERTLARKAVAALPYYRAALRASNVRIVPDPLPDDLAPHQEVIGHSADVPIVRAAMRAEVDYVVTLNRKHFIDDPNVATRSGLRIGTPGDALAWLREGYLRDPENV